MARVGRLKRLNEVERDICSRHANVMVDGRFDISPGQIAEEDRLFAHFSELAVLGP